MSRKTSPTDLDGFALINVVEKGKRTDAVGFNDLCTQKKVQKEEPRRVIR